MQYNDYQWTAYPYDDPRATGKPDSTKLNRLVGYEVLYLINTLAVAWNLKQVSSCLKMEKLIREELPSKTIIQVDVKEWISKNWTN
jgi:hypothetical protein